MKNFKVTLILVAMMAAFAACDMDSKQEEKEAYVISGQIDGNLPPALPIVYLRAVNKQDFVVLDSCQLNADGSFKLQGKAEEPMMAYITSDLMRNGIPIFLENIPLQVNMHMDSLPAYEVKGSVAQDVYMDVEAKNAELDGIWQGYYFGTFKKMSPEEQKANEAYVNRLYDSAMKLKSEYIATVIDNNLGSFATPYIIIKEQNTLGDEKVLEYYEKLQPQALASQPGKDLSERIAIMKRTQVGQPLIDFSMEDADGKMVRLSEAVKGKIVLIDFWASWCSPCRAENPNVVANYKKYHKDGFEVIGVSFDKKKENWLKAVKDDNLTWLQLSDLQGWKCAAGKLYGIRSIPQNILLNKEGVIIARNLRGDELGKKLAELF